MKEKGTKSFAGGGIWELIFFILDLIVFIMITRLKISPVEGWPWRSPPLFAFCVNINNDGSVPTCFRGEQNRLEFRKLSKPDFSKSN